MKIVFNPFAGKFDYVVSSDAIDHGLLLGLADDDHSQYFLLAGRNGGQTLIGGIDSGNNLTLQSTSHVTKGTIYLMDNSDFNNKNTVNINKLLVGTTDTTKRKVYFKDATSNLICRLESSTDGTIGWEYYQGTTQVADILFNVGGLNQIRFKNFILDGDFEFYGNDGGSNKLIMKLDVSEGQLTGLIKATSGVLGNASAGTDYEVPLTFSTGLTRTINTITTNDGQINHNNLLNTHNLTTDIDHNSITNLAVGDVHTQYVLLVGRTSGQTVYGGVATTENLIFHSNTAKDGKIYLGDNSYFDEATGFLNLDRGLQVNVSGGDYDSYIKGSTDDNLFYIDAGNNRIGIGTNVPDFRVTIKQTAHNNGIKIYGYDTASAAFGKYHVDNNGYAVFDSSGQTHFKAAGNTVLSFSTAPQGTFWASCRIIDDKYLSFGNSNEWQIKKAAADGFLNFSDGTNKYLTFTTSEIVINESGINRDTRIEGDTSINCFTLDAGNDNITINGVAVSANYDLMLAGDGVLGLKETSTPTADTNYGKVYCKDDNNLYFQDGSGVEHQLAFV